MRNPVFITALILLFLTAAFAQTASKPKVQNVPAKYTSAASGKEMFNSYCASCHGITGKGDGPAAPAMKSGVPDLTTLSKSHGGTFPAMSVTQSIVGDTRVVAHGSKAMPVWGPVFAHMSQQSTGEIQQRLHNLTDYVESLQAK
jgi:mono/diheme cytochrome c family protein